MNVNTMGMLNVTSLIFPLMAARKSGHVINISSVCVSKDGQAIRLSDNIFDQGRSVRENHLVYGAGKYFLEGFSEGLRREGLRDGIKVREQSSVT